MLRGRRVAEMPLKVHPRLYLDIGWGDLWFGMMAGGKASGAEASRAALRKTFGADAVAALSVRSALLALLRAMKPAYGAEVLMSGVNIENMADVVRACGLTPVPVDIDLETLAPSADAVRAAITERTVIYLHAHLYGSRNALGAHAAVCQQRGVLLVEDCAQAYDGRAYLGSPVADVSLFSFGPIKPATTLGGAVARVRDDALRAGVEAEMAGWPEQANAAVARRARKLMMLKALSGPHLFAGVLALMKWRKLDADVVIGAAARGFKASDLVPQISHRPAPRLLSLMARRLSLYPRAGWRRGHALRLRAALHADVFTPGGKAADHAYWLFPVLVDNAAELIDALRREGFDATRGATSMRAVGGAATPVAQRMIERVVYLPLTPGLTARDVDRMAAVVNRLCVSGRALAA